MNRQKRTISRRTLIGAILGIGLTLLLGLGIASAFAFAPLQDEASQQEAVSAETSEGEALIVFR